MDTGQKIKQIRQEHEMTQHEFAASIGISRSALTQLEAGHTKPSYDVLEKLIDHFDVDIQMFFNPTVEPSRKKLDNVVEVGMQVQKIRHFYDREYGLRYNSLLLDRLVQQVAEGYPDREKAEIIQKSYEAYAIFHGFGVMLDQILVDPLKRYANKVRKLRQQEGKEEEDEALYYDSEDLKEHLDSIVNETVKYMGNGEGIVLHCVEILKQQSYSDTVFFTSSLAKVLHASREENLYHFEVLLKNAEALEEVEHYYKTQHHFFGEL